MKGSLYAIPLGSIAHAPRYERSPKGHHITLAYDVDQSAYASSEGVIFSAPIVSRCWSDQVECLKVILPTGIPCEMAHPHLTISWGEDSAPVQAKIMLAQGGYQEDLFDDPVVATFRIEFVPFDAPRYCPRCAQLGGALPLPPQNKSGWCARHVHLSPERRGNRRKKI